MNIQQRRVALILSLMILSTLIALQGCDRHGRTMPHHYSGGDSGLPSSNDTNIDGEPDLILSLRTEIANGRFVFIGNDALLAERVNPDIEVEVGQLVEINLVNNDGVVHDLAIPELGVSTTRISQMGAEANLKFLAENPGRYSYYCTVPGHRQAGMEGQLIIGEKSAERL